MEHPRPLLTPNELIRVEKDKALIGMGTCHLMRLVKSYYNALSRIAIARAAFSCAEF